MYIYTVNKFNKSIKNPGLLIEGGATDRFAIKRPTAGGTVVVQ